jgi:hypothetical protein
MCLVIKCVDGTVHMQGIFSPDADPTHPPKSAEPPHPTFSNRRGPPPNYSSRP